MESESHVGRRVREIRTLRGLTLTACAGLAGMAKSNLSRIESGQQAVTRKPTLEALAAALRVAPSELTGQPFRATTADEVHGLSAVDALRAVLRDVEVGALDDAPARPLDELSAEAARATAMREACDYASLGETVPALLAAAFRAVQRGSAAARAVLIDALMVAFRLSKDLGHFDVAWAVSGHLHAVTAAAGDPAWIGVSEFLRAEAMTGADSRVRALSHVRRAADDVVVGPGDTGQVHGLLRLSAALQSAVLGDVDAVNEYVDQASDVARFTGEGNFAGQHFGPTNIGVWKIGLAVEVGDVEVVPALARGMDVASIPHGRRASFFIDLGRGFAAQRGSEADAVRAFRQAEELAPQTTRADPYVRETVGDLLRRARRDAGGRELRGMAYRLGMGA